MIFRKSILRIVVCLFIGLCLSACGLNTASMIPDLKPISEGRISQSVTVADVTGARKVPWGGPAFISNEQFKDVLIATLIKSQIFKAVDSQRGDLTLNATIREQEQFGFLEARVHLIVEYRFVNKDDGRVVWQETYISEYDFASIIGASRTIGANEGAVRDNVSLLIDGIIKRWPRSVSRITN